MRIRLFSFLFFFAGLYLIVSLARDVNFLAQKGQEVGKARLQLDSLHVENERLKRQLQEVESPEFVEKEAREKLGMSKPNETILILPKDFEDRVVAEQAGKNTVQEEANWKKWWGLFF